MQPRPGPARDRATCPARQRASAASRWTWTIRSTRPSPACGSCARPSPRSTTGSTAGACPASTAPRTSAVSGGGRTALTRAAASLGHINLGHFLPDYTAYEELLDVFKAFTAIPILLEGERGYAFTAEDLRREILGRGPVRAPLLEPVQPDRQARAGRGAGALGRRRARARLRAAPRRVLLALHLDGAPRTAPGGERRALRGGREQGSRSSSSTASPRTGATRAGA